MKKQKKLKKLNKSQEKIVKDVVRLWLRYKKVQKELRKLFVRSGRLGVPITHLSKLLNINKTVIWRRQRRGAKIKGHNNKKNKKYKITKETIELYGGKKLYRIEALKNFGDIKKGDKGGWIEKEDNLSQDGNAWVYNDAWVFDNAHIFGNARVYDGAKVYGNAQVYGNARIYGGACVYDDAWVSGNTWVFGNAKISSGILSGGEFFYTYQKSEKEMIKVIDTTNDNNQETLTYNPIIKKS
jgi:hypothetical protein